MTVEVYGLSLGMGVTIDLYTETIYTDEVEEEDTVYTYNPTLDRVLTRSKTRTRDTARKRIKSGTRTARRRGVKRSTISDYRKITPPMNTTTAIRRPPSNAHARGGPPS